MNRQALLGFLLGVLVLGALWLWFQFSIMAPPETPAEARDLPSERTAAPDRTDEAQPRPDTEPGLEQITGEDPDRETAEEAPLFEQPHRVAEETREGMRLGRPDGEQMEEMREIQRELMELNRPGTNPAPADVSRLIGRLRGNIGTDEVGGVNLNDLQQDLEVIDRMQEQAMRIGEMARDADADNIDHLMDMTRELEDMQTGLSDGLLDEALEERLEEGLDGDG